MENLKRPLVSVGIATYNRPKGLKATLNCISNQTYENLEIIVSDNCSPSQESDEVVREFLSYDSRIKFYKQPKNHGPYFNFCFVLENAKGEYFMWAADDDLWENNFIEEMVIQHFSSPLVASAFCNIREINRSHEIVGNFSYSRMLAESDLYVRLSAWVSMKETYLGKASLIYGLHRTSYIRKIISGSDLSFYSGDNIIVLSMLLLGPIALSDKFLYSLGTDNEKHYDPLMISKVAVEEPQSVFRSTLNYALSRHRYFNEAIMRLQKCELRRGQYVGLVMRLRRREAHFLIRDVMLIFRNCIYIIRSTVMRFLYRLKQIISPRF